jgi:Domain of unknown function (DUF5658)
MVRVAGLMMAAVFVISLGVPAAASAEDAPALAPANVHLSVAPALPHRPPALMPLYAAFVALQVLDVQSTRDALAHGAAEGNPLMSGLTGSTFGMVAVKAAGTAGVVLASERLWKRNKPAAILVMIATNSAMTWVVQHNYRAAR